MRKTTLFLLACASEAQARYLVKPNIVYGVQNNYETKLDVYQRGDTQGPQPTIIYIHGGGWTGGSKETAIFPLFPYFEMGWNVVNVEYRLEKVSPAPCAGSACTRKMTTST